MCDSSSDDGEPEIFGDEAISQAVERNDTHTLRRLLKKRKQNAVPLSADDRGRTALHVAASRPEYEKCLELLLQHADGMLDLNARTVGGRTALHIACEGECEENVLLLLQKGCDPSVTSEEFSRSPLHIAVLSGNLKIVEYLLGYLANEDGKYQGDVKPLHLALVEDQWDIFRLLLQKGLSIQSEDANGDVLLHRICEKKNSYYSSWFFEYADLTLINHQNHDGVTPFMYAVQRFDLAGVQHLLENGANTDLYDKYVYGVLQYAIESRNTEVFHLLLQSTDLSHYKKICLNTFPFIGTQNADCIFISLVRSAISASNLACLDILMTSGLPKSILQMPDVEPDGDMFRIYTPLAYLFKFGVENNEFDSYLHLLLDHKVTLMDEFRAEFQVKWPCVDTIFRHPFTDLVLSPEKLHYFELLIANGVTTDYCLQCYHDNTQPFDTFTNYKTYYESVILAITLRDVEIMKLFLFNSAILEPERLLPYIIRIISSYRTAEEMDMYQYLISLKPSVYRVHAQVRQYLSDLVSEEFPISTLQQLCRTAIRQQLREPSLDDNLRNFRRKILELPLPNSLKDYLLFKN